MKIAESSGTMDRGTAARPSVSVVVPVYNEAENLEALDSELRASLLEIGQSTEIVYVDDASTDGSTAVLEALVRNATPELPTRLIRLSRNFGQASALAAGFEVAEGEVVVSIDGDLQNLPADIPRLLEKLEEGYDMVSGWRRHRQDSATSRIFPSWVANKLISALSGIQLHDYGCTLKAYRSAVLREVPLYGDMHRFIPVYIAHIGGSIAELEVQHRPRTAGKSKYGLSRILKVLVDLVAVRFVARYAARPMQFFGQVAVLFLGATGMIVAAMLALKYGWLAYVGVSYRASFVETPLPSLAGTFLLGGIVCLFFGIVAELLTRAQFEKHIRKPYRIAGIMDSRRIE